MLLTLLAPAERCNQRCPACILESMGEPVDEFDLRPSDYARFLQQFADAGIPILSVAFQGYEVTLPRSWPYVEAVFLVAKTHDIRRGFITNGMLLHKWVDRLVALDPDHITVSLDGASAEENDRIRGLPGAFDAACHSLRRIVSDVPRLAKRMAIASTLYDEANFRSLLDMPDLLARLRIHRWAVSWELRREGSSAEAAQPRDTVFRWLRALKDAAEDRGIAFHTGDDFGTLDASERAALRARRVYNLDFMYRLDPVGGVRKGSELMDVWSEASVRRWNPATDNAVETLGYWEQAKPYIERLARQSSE